MHEAVELWEKPEAKEIYAIAGWRQWADAGSVSSGLPKYLVEHTGARQIGEIRSAGFYLFQIPGTHDLLRPEVKFEDGYRTKVNRRTNEFFYTGNEERGLLIFLGEEPHMDVDGYINAFFDVISELGVRRVAGLGGVYGSMPYDVDRHVSCVYSKPALKAELTDYAVNFSNYGGGASLGSFLVDRAEQRDIEYFTFYSFVPAYDFSQTGSMMQGMRIENDFRAWYELMRRFNYMFNLGVDLSDLEQQSSELTLSMDAKIEELEKKMPESKVRGYLADLTANFTEKPFMPLDDVWERELGDLFDETE